MNALSINQPFSINELLEKTAEVYYYGDHITGDMLLTQCISMIRQLYQVPEKQQAVITTLSAISQAKQQYDFTQLADILRYQAPSLLAC